MTANPAKLAKIGKELEKLGKEINLMTPVSEVPFPTRLVQAIIFVKTFLGKMQPMFVNKTFVYILQTIIVEELFIFGIKCSTSFSNDKNNFY